MHSIQEPFQARKSLGQNFLHDENVARKIVRAIDPQAGETIIEIGPGKGVLTRYLVDSGCRYIGVEIDERLIPGLQAQYGAKPNVQIYHCDFRNLDFAGFAFAPATVRLVGNIPYHITSSILFRAFEQQHFLRDMVLMVQKEVAARIVAGPGSKTYGLLSVISQTYSQPALLFTVSRHVFTPRPAVESAVVRWDFTRKQQPQPVDPGAFQALVKAAFNQRRKMLGNALKALASPELLQAVAGEHLSARAETLPVEAFIEISNALQFGEATAKSKRALQSPRHTRAKTE